METFAIQVKKDYPENTTMPFGKTFNAKTYFLKAFLIGITTKLCLYVFLSFFLSVLVFLCLYVFFNIFKNLVETFAIQVKKDYPENTTMPFGKTFNANTYFLKAFLIGKTT